MSLKHIFFAAVVVVLGTVLFFGFTAADYWTFGGQSSHDTGAGAHLTLWVDTHVESVSVMGVKLFTKSRSPFSIRFGFSTEKRTITAAILTNVTVKYKQSIAELAMTGEHPTRWLFTEHRYSNWTSNQLAQHQVWQITRSLTNCINKPEAFELECDGLLELANGDKVPFHVKESFVPKKVSGIFRGWHIEAP